MNRIAPILALAALPVLAAEAPTPAANAARIAALESTLHDRRCLQLAPRWHPAERFCLPAAFAPGHRNGWRFTERQAQMFGVGPSTAHLELVATVGVSKNPRASGEYAYRHDRHRLALTFVHYHFGGVYPRVIAAAWSFHAFYEDLALADAERITAAFLAGFRVASAHGAHNNLDCRAPVGDLTTRPAISGITTDAAPTRLHRVLAVAETLTVTLPADADGPLCR